jgi:hypothetical protein
MTQPTLKVFVDLDGVLVDFDRGVLAATGFFPWQQDKKRMWPLLARVPGFYAGLAWMPDGKRLWERLAPLEPTVLTGLPMGGWARPQKLEWCRRELGGEVPVIACLSRHKAEKAREAAPEGRRPLLIDDREELGRQIEELGGLFIHHRSAEETIAELDRLLAG